MDNVITATFNTFEHAEKEIDKLGGMVSEKEKKKTVSWNLMKAFGIIGFDAALTIFISSKLDIKWRIDYFIKGKVKFRMLFNGGKKHCDLSYFE